MLLRRGWRARLLADPVWGPLLLEGGQPLDGVLADFDAVGDGPPDLQATGKVYAEAAQGCLFDTPHGERGVVADLGGHRLDGRQQLVGWDDAVDQVEAQSVPGAHELTGHEQLHSEVVGDLVGEHQRATHRGDAALDLGPAELGRVDGDPNVRQQGQSTALGQAEPVDSGDDWLVELREVEVEIVGGALTGPAAG